MFFDPLGGWRHVKVTDRRTKADWAKCMQELVDIHYPQAELIRVVLDNLNTHNPAVLYETFEPVKAKRILSKLEFHYTPVLRLRRHRPPLAPLLLSHAQSAALRELDRQAFGLVLRQ